MTDPVLAAQGADVRAAAVLLRRAGTEAKDAALRGAAQCLIERADAILAANQTDLAAARAQGRAPAALDRLMLDEHRLAAMADGLEGVARLPDPVGEVVDGSVRPNGLRVERVRVPLGVVGVIYENRPNVTTDAAGLCLKAGNAAYLRGSASAQATNLEVVAALREGLAAAGLPKSCVALVEDTSRETVVAFMQLRGIIDCLIPRGGRDLVAAMREHATVPYVLDGDGNCHVYVDATADLDLADAHRRQRQDPAPRGVQRHRDAPRAPRRRGRPLAAPRRRARRSGAARRRGHAVPRARRARGHRGGLRDRVLGPRARRAVVDSLDAAIDHVARYSSGHSEAIVTADVAAADRWVREVDAAAVLVNASTRFVDGGELGLGAEIGISTQKLHARGPMGLRELTSVR